MPSALMTLTSMERGGYLAARAGLAEDAECTLIHRTSISCLSHSFNGFDESLSALPPSPARTRALPVSPEFSEFSVSIFGLVQIY